MDKKRKMVTVLSENQVDFQAMQQAAAQMREGLAEFEAGIAAQRVLSEGKAPRNLALWNALCARTGATHRR